MDTTWTAFALDLTVNTAMLLNAMDHELLSTLSDDVLTAALKRLAGCERQATVALISHLAEFDARRLYLPAGFSSPFTYCTDVLRMSEHGAYNRIEAARAAKRFPAILGMLAQGTLTLATIRLVAPHLTDENQAELLAAAAGKSKRSVEELVARIAPRPAVPPSIRKLPDVAPIHGADPATAARTPPSPLSRALHRENASVPSTPAVAEATTPSSRSMPTRRPAVTPLAEDRYQIRFTAREQTIEKLKLAQALLRHAVPTGDVAEIMDRALTALVQDLGRKKFAAVAAPRPARRTRPGSRDIPSAVMRAVWLRDDGRCRFVSVTGRRCDERGFLEYHHVKPYGVGGEATPANLELRCAMHNRYEAELYYGPINACRSQRDVKQTSAPSARIGLTTTRPGAS